MVSELSARGVKRLYESGGVSDKQGIARRTGQHTGDS